MDMPPGRREAHKLATRAALQGAARRLFAERGYEATTAAEIARAANVAERTFYRYFDGKEELLAEDALAQIGALHDAIVGRPVEETPWVAVARAMNGLARPTARGRGPGPLRLVIDLPGPLAGLRRATQRPLRRLEEAIADALLSRLASGAVASRLSNSRALPPAFEAQLLARVGVAVLRTAAIRHRQLEAAGAPGSPGIDRLLEAAFASLAELV